MRGANTYTFFGQAWLVLNPLLLAGVYYLLVTIIRQRTRSRAVPPPDRWRCSPSTMVQTLGHTGATSVTGSGKLLINTAFPRLLIPLSAVRTAFFRFLPTIPVYLVFHAIFGQSRWHPRMLVSLYFLVTMVVFSMGLAALFATLQVYFRDTSQLPAVLRPAVDVSVAGAVAAGDAAPLQPRAAVARRAQPDVPDAHRLRRRCCRTSAYPPLWMWSRRRPGRSARSSSVSGSSSRGSVSSLSASPRRSSRPSPLAVKVRQPVDHLPDHLRAQADAEARRWSGSAAGQRSVREVRPSRT